MLSKKIVCRRRDYKFIQKHNRDLNRVPARTYIFTCLNQLSYRCHERMRVRERMRVKKREIEKLSEWKKEVEDKYFHT